MTINTHLDIKNENVLTIIKTAFLKSWMTETAAEIFREKTKTNIMAGQCVPTSLIMQDYFGGIILCGELSNASHFFNLIDGKVFDLTAGQFDDEIVYSKEPQEIVRHALLDGAENRLTLYKYNLLKVGFEKNLEILMRKMST